MSVGSQLGLSDPDADLLADARKQWPVWSAQHIELRVTPDLLALPAWLRAAHPADADEVLHPLARLASPSGADDVVAAGALAWLLLGGACALAHSLRALTPRIDEVVAAQLWLEVRGFAWQRRRKVAANVLMSTRRGVLRDLEVGEHLRETDPTWARSIQTAPEDDLWRILEGRPGAEPMDAARELRDVLVAAVREHVIDEHDRDLLVSLALEADAAGVTRVGCGQGGLCSRRVAVAVAARHGMAESTVRRRAARTVRALADAYAQTRA
jgi:hypothetical protein